MLEHRIYRSISEYDIGLLEGLEVDGFDRGNELLFQGSLESVVLFEDFVRAVVRAVLSRYLWCGEAGALSVVV